MRFVLLTLCTFIFSIASARTLKIETPYIIYPGDKVEGWRYVARTKDNSAWVEVEVTQYSLINPNPVLSGPNDGYLTFWLQAKIPSLQYDQQNKSIVFEDGKSPITCARLTGNWPLRRFAPTEKCKVNVYLPPLSYGDEFPLTLFIKIED